MNFVNRTFMASYLHQFSIVLKKIYFFVLFGTKFNYIWCKFSIIIWRINALTPPSILIGAIWDELGAQHHNQQSIKKLHIQYQIGTILVQIKHILVGSSGIFGIIKNISSSIWFMTWVRWDNIREVHRNKNIKSLQI